MLALPRPGHGKLGHDHARPAQISRRQRAILHYGEMGQEQQNAALGRHFDRRANHKPLGLCVEPEETMSNRLAVCAAFIALCSGQTAGAQEALRVCLNEDLPPLSVHHRDTPDSGFDVALANAVAQKLGRSLEIQWFESKLDEDSSPALEANALLSDRRCSVVGSYALTKDSLVVPGVKTAKLPGFEGATREDRRRRVPLGVLASSQPYIYSPLTVVLGGSMRDHHISGIGDLAGLRISIESGTLADAILMTFDNGRLIDHITHLVPGRHDLLGALNGGEFDATLLDLSRFDAYRAGHPDSRLAASGYYYPIGEPGIGM